jgi:hypothetical protein
MYNQSTNPYPDNDALLHFSFKKAFRSVKNVVSDGGKLFLNVNPLVFATEAISGKQIINDNYNTKIGKIAEGGNTISKEIGKVIGDFFTAGGATKLSNTVQSLINPTPGQPPVAESPTTEAPKQDKNQDLIIAGGAGLVVVVLLLIILLRK